MDGDDFCLMNPWVCLDLFFFIIEILNMMKFFVVVGYELVCHTSLFHLPNGKKLGVICKPSETGHVQNRSNN